jgi:radial spoke head protein 3
MLAALRRHTLLTARRRSQDSTLYANIMHDPRIVRGNTYSMRRMPTAAESNPLEQQQRDETIRRQMARKRALEMLQRRTPEPVDGRIHMDVQTEVYLEEILERVPEKDQSAQTDAFLDRPPSPLFIPAKTGRDVATQILEGELFDFDLEVQPILDVLVGKTVEQALMEVMEEEELALLRKHQEEFETIRNAELAETQRLEEEERRRREERERRLAQEKEMRRKELETRDKIAARAFAVRYLETLVPSVLGTLEDAGFFFDPVEREIETGFMPWLYARAAEEQANIVRSRALLDSIIQASVVQNLAVYAPYDVLVVDPVEVTVVPAAEAAAPAAVDVNVNDAVAAEAGAPAEGGGGVELVVEAALEIDGGAGLFGEEDAASGEPAAE